MSDSPPRLGGWLLILSRLLLVYQPVSLALSASAALNSLPTRGPKVLIAIAVRVIVTGVCVAAGLALTKRGVRVVEFNARFGDPETQPLLALLESPLGVVLKAAADGRLDEIGPLKWRDGAAVAVVVAAHNYPDTPRRGDVVHGVHDADRLEGVDVIHAGTAVDDEGHLVTAGGRVLAVTAVGATVADARARAYDGVAKIRIDGGHHRTDIAADAARMVEERTQ